MRAWIKNTLIAALGASVALGGMAFASNARMGGCGWHGGPVSEADAAKFRDKMIERATSELSLDANQRQNLVALADTLNAQRQSMMAGGAANMRELVSQMAKIGEVEGFRVVLRVGDYSVDSMKRELREANLQNVTLLPIKDPAEEDFWSEDYRDLIELA